MICTGGARKFGQHAAPKLRQPQSTVLGSNTKAFRFSLTANGTGRSFTVLGSNTMTYEIAYMSAWMDVFVLVFWNSAIFFFVLFGKLTYVNLRPTTWPCTYSKTTHTCDVMQMGLSFGHATTILLEALAMVTSVFLPNLPFLKKLEKGGRAVLLYRTRCFIRGKILD